MEKCDRFGLHRVVGHKHLPQQAYQLKTELPIFENEMLIEVESLNIDSASFHQIKMDNSSDPLKMADAILSIVTERGKMQNPVTGSGGMLIGKVKELGLKFLEGHVEKVKVGDRIATLVSLTLTPLKIEKIKKIHMDIDRVDIEGHAVLFQSGLFSVLPTDLSDTLALAILDVCGAPAQTAALCKTGQNVAVIGGAGKSGLLCLYEAKKKVGDQGKVIAFDYSAEALKSIEHFSFIDERAPVDARNAMDVHAKVKALTQGRMCDVVINVANIPDTEMSTILSCKPGGTAYFFNMATQFSKATLGAEGVGAHVDLMMGNGYRPGHAELALNILRESRPIREYMEKKYGSS